MTIEIGTSQAATRGHVWVEKLGTAVIDLLFPPHCAICGVFGSWLCPKCVDSMDRLEALLCPACRRPRRRSRDVEPRRATCNAHHHRQHQIDGLVAYGVHEGALRLAIHRFKYEGLQTLASPLGHLMAEAWKRFAPKGLRLDGIVPVPLHPSRRRQRGFCQATLLAKELAAQLYMPAFEDVLIRTKRTVPQVGLTASERQSNVRGAFRCAGTSPADKHLLLVDDVYTTGSTLESACETLRQAGSLSVWATALALARS